MFTVTHDIGSQIDTAYRSLLRQSYPHWEWVVVDDSHGTETGDHVARLADELAPGRIRLYRQHPQTGSIGANKAVAAGACHGEFLIELDHDDELLPDALDIVVATFLAHPDIDFVYSDCIDWEDRPNGGVAATYPPGWGLGFGAYGSEIIGGRRIPVALVPPLTWETVRHIVAMPNHVRAWRTASYHRVGGHDWRLPEADDYELVLRTFLNGVAARIPRALYVQHHDPRGANASRRRNPEIQRRVVEISARWRDVIDRRCLFMGVTPSPPEPLTSWQPVLKANAVIDVVAEAAEDRGRPLVSVIVPTYNRPAPLERALESILGQTYENFEALVVGDNCPHVDEVVACFDDPRVRHWNLADHHCDAGASPRNYALKTMARGTLVAYLDDDNRWRHDHLESLVDLMLADPGRTFAFSSLKIGADTVLCRRPRHMQIDTSALLHRRFLLERYGYWRGPRDTPWAWAHDWELVSRWEGEPWAASLVPSLYYNLGHSDRPQDLLAAIKAVAEEERRLDPISRSPA